jgi:hypothetical protein
MLAAVLISDKLFIKAGIYQSIYVALVNISFTAKLYKDRQFSLQGNILGIIARA